MSDSILVNFFLTRKLRRWRWISALLFISLLTALYFIYKRDFAIPLDYIARIDIKGMITGDKATLDLIKKIENSSSAKALIVTIESPGGTVTGSEKIYEALRAVSLKKPVIAEIQSLGASGGYISAIGADYIIAKQTSLVGSIGVLFTYPNLSKLMDTIGVKMEEVKSSPLKAAPNAYEPASKEAKAALESLVKDNFVWFKDLVKQRRNLNDEELSKVSDGRVFTGKNALSLKLIDKIGGEADSLYFLSQKGITQLPIKLIEQDKKNNLSLLGLISENLLPDTLQLLKNQSQSFATLKVEGMLALWVP